MGQLTKDEMLARVRKKLQDKQGSKFKADPTQWKPPTVGPTETKSYKFIILPPLSKGDPCWTDAGPGTSKSITDMGDLYYYQAGQHWIDKRPYECPRIHDEAECPICQLGFDLMAETEDKDTRSRIAKNYLSKNNQVVNIYFLDVQSNPEDVRGKVFWFSISQKGVFDRFSECINRDESEAAGDTPEEAKAWGLFYMPDQCYVFNLIIKQKNKYNDYGDSKFLPSTRGYLATANGKPDVEKIRTILNSRHDLSAKFSPRDRVKLQELTQKLMSAGSEPANESGGWNEQESPQDKAPDKIQGSAAHAESKSPTSTPTPSAPVSNAAADEPDDELQRLLEELTPNKK